MEIKKIVEEVGQNAKDKGFWDRDLNVGELLMLTVSEAGEAMESHRKGKFADVKSYYNRIEDIRNSFNESNSTKEDLVYRMLDVEKSCFEKYVKDSFEDEIADTIIRLFDICARMDIDIESHIALKMNYNSKREKLHGKNY